MTEESPELFWDATYAITLALLEHCPETKPEDVGLMELADLVCALPGFSDDPGLVTDEILFEIQSTWYEEVTSL